MSLTYLSSSVSAMPNLRQPKSVAELSDGAVRIFLLGLVCCLRNLCDKSLCVCPVIFGIEKLVC